MCWSHIQMLALIENIKPLIEIITEVLLIYLFVYPGASVRWLIFRLWRSNKTFKDFIKDDYYMNGMIGLITFGLLLALIVIII